MRAAIYNPYWDTLGGGERYTISVAEILARQGWEVDVEWPDPGIKSKLEKRFGLELEKVNIVPDIKRGDGYDVCFWLSDGSIPTLKARKNLLHFQFPFKDVNGTTLLNKMKLFRINKIICNSNFTKKFTDREYGVNSIVIYPPVSVEKFKPLKKDKQIIYVGRFSGLTQSKGQDILIDAFKKFYDSGNKTWKLILAGGVEVGAEQYLDQLKQSAKTYPVKFAQSPSFKDLKELVGESSIFWSAAGYGANEEHQPLKVEHFGMTVVEAMAAATVPLVTPLGGHKETVKPGINGETWSSVDELINKTNQLIANPKMLRQLAKNGQEESKLFSYARFEKELLALL